MRVLVACEESQAVCKAFRERGHEAYSCDLQECSGGHPEWHIQGDALAEIAKEGWDLIIAHPPCTHLAVSGARWFPEKQRDFRQQKAVVFFMQMIYANAEKVAVENPIGIMSKCYRKPDQIIQPYEYGHPFRKSTCLWLKNLKKLEPTNIVEPELVSYICKDGKKVTFSADYGGGDKTASTRRSKTYEGIAKAMAEQWG